MKVREAVELAREWVTAQRKDEPRFVAAHLIGGLSGASPDADFPRYIDIDLGIVLEEKDERDLWQVEYCGMALEVTFRGVDEYRPSEVVLASPSLAPHFAVDTILADPQGLLAELHSVVRQDYARRRWVEARCAEEQRMIHEFLVKPTIGVFIAMMTVSGLLAVADLRKPTHRRALILMAEILEEQGRSDLYEKALSIMGFASLTRAQVESYLAETLRAYDRALEVFRTPYEASYKLRPHLRPYLAEGAREMIAEGHHREAMMWILLGYFTAMGALENDAPTAEKQQHLAAFGGLMRELGLGSPDAWRAGVEATRAFAEECFTLAEYMIDFHPDIRD